MCIQNFVKICPLVLKTLSGNEILTSIKGRKSDSNLPKMTPYNPNLDLFNVDVYTKFVEFYPFILKILSGNEILTLIKDRNSVANLQKIMFYNHNLDLINVNVYTKFG